MLIVVALSACGPNGRSAASLSLPSRTLGVAAVGDVVVALSEAASGENVSVIARDGTILHQFHVRNAVDVAAASDAADFLVNDSSFSRVERRALDGRMIQARPLKVRIDGLGPEIDGERLGVLRRPSGTIVSRLDGRALARFAPDVARIGVCQLGPASYLVAASSGGTSLFGIHDRKRHAVAVAGIDATCIETLSGTMLGIVQRNRAESDIVVVALPVLQQIAALPLASGASRITANDRTAYVLIQGADASARILPRETLDFREQLIHDVHFK